jgi:pimeloyl-ACP methyl ester carboxylesterase
MGTHSRNGSTVDVDAYGPVGRSEWLDVDWRAHQRWVTVAGRPLNVIDIGPTAGGEPAGGPVVFVHGLSGSWQNWLENIPVFARRRRVVAMDLPGFGGSPMPDEKISIPGYGRILDGLLDELDIDAAAVVGNSMGGFIAAEAAIQLPERVERLVLVAAAGLSSVDIRNERQLAVLRRAEFVVTAYAGWVASKSASFARRRRLRSALFALVARYPERLPAPLIAEQLRGSGTPGFVDAIDALTDYPIRDRLGEIRCPTLIVQGTHDRLVPRRDADEFERLIPGSRKLIYEDTGHVPMLERPARFNADLEAFLQEDPGERVDEQRDEAAV